jgi:hypothetical protein
MHTQQITHAWVQHLDSYLAISLIQHLDFVWSSVIVCFFIYKFPPHENQDLK